MIGIRSTTALMHAAANGSALCIPFLLEKEACVQDASGWSALAWATYLDKPECAKLLMGEKDIELTPIVGGYAGDGSNGNTGSGYCRL